MLVGCLLYLAVATHPDISYYAMWLGQFNASPTRAHFLLAKHVLHYLAGTKLLALCLGSSSLQVPLSLSGYLQNVGCSDVDWASNAVPEEYLWLFFLFPELTRFLVCRQAEINRTFIHGGRILHYDTCFQGGPLDSYFS